MADTAAHPHFPAPPAPAAAHVKAYTGLLRLAVRLFSREADTALYRQLLAADERFHAEEHPRFLDPALAREPEDAAVERLAEEYCRLFIGPGPAAPPYASAQQRQAKLGGPQARAMTAFLDRHRLRSLPQPGDAVLEPDHLAVQLALLAHLYGTCCGTATGGPPPAAAWAAAHELLHRHILTWTPAYLDRLAGTAIPPYRTIARLLRKVLTEAADWPGTTPPTATPRPHTPDEAHGAPMITVYTTPACGYCHRLKSRLNAEAIPFTEVSIEHDPDSAALVEKINNGNQVVPTVVFADGTAMTNPGIPKIKQHLARTA